MANTLCPPIGLPPAPNPAHSAPQFCATPDSATNSSEDGATKDHEDNEDRSSNEQDVASCTARRRGIQSLADNKACEPRLSGRLKSTTSRTGLAGRPITQRRLRPTRSSIKLSIRRLTNTPEIPPWHFGTNDPSQLPTVSMSELGEGVDDLILRILHDRPWAGRFLVRDMAQPPAVVKVPRCVISEEDGGHDLVAIRWTPPHEQPRGALHLHAGFRKTFPGFHLDTTARRPSLPEVRKHLTRLFRQHDNPLFRGERSYCVGPPLLEEGVLGELTALVAPGARLGSHGDLLGITSPYQHFGEVNSGTAFHKEDGELGSLNLTIYGYSVWILIDLEHNKAFLDLCLANRAQEPSPLCDQIVRHGNHFFSPDFLTTYNIKHRIEVVGPGELIVTRPNEYHAVLNLCRGMKCAINVAWPGYGLAHSPWGETSVCDNCGLSALADDDGDVRRVFCRQDSPANSLGGYPLVQSTSPSRPFSNSRAPSLFRPGYISAHQMPRERRFISNKLLQGLQSRSLPCPVISKAFSVAWDLIDLINHVRQSSRPCAERPGSAEVEMEKNVASVRNAILSGRERESSRSSQGSQTIVGYEREQQFLRLSREGGPIVQCLLMSAGSSHITADDLESFMVSKASVEHPWHDTLLRACSEVVEYIVERRRPLPLFGFESNVPLSPLISTAGIVAHLAIQT